MSTASAPAIRRARRPDVDGILDLERHFPSDRMSRASLLRLLRRPSAQLWIARDADAILGALVLLTRADTKIARIYSLVVAPQARGRGIAQQLVLAAERSAQRLRRSAMSLEVRADNDAARGLYARLGYDEWQRMAGYYEDGMDGLRLRKPLR